ncbi:MAG TPA: (d)CMP kinase [Bacteroidales bacterium]|nr:(d)CMP kinase [Bacteroidales bacterium]
MQKNTKNGLTIAVDGYSSCGKSTFARRIADELGYIYIDSGAMYRAVTLFGIEKGYVDDGRVDEAGLKKSLDNLDIGFVKDESTGRYLISMNGREVENEIRSMAVSENVSPVSRIGEIRERMVKLQRSVGGKNGVVMDGRDIGTVVFPGADIKIFMTADPHIRAERRFAELQAKGIPASLEKVEHNIRERDHIDETRAVSPLKKADDADILDNSYMSVEEQMQWFRDLLKKHDRENKH